MKVQVGLGPEQLGQKQPAQDLPGKGAVAVEEQRPVPGSVEEEGVGRERVAWAAVKGQQYCWCWLWGREHLGSQLLRLRWRQGLR